METSCKGFTAGHGAALDVFWASDHIPQLAGDFEDFGSTTVHDIGPLLQVDEYLRYLPYLASVR